MCQLFRLASLRTRGRMPCISFLSIQEFVYQFKLNFFLRLHLPWFIFQKQQSCQKNFGPIPIFKWGKRISLYESNSLLFTSITKSLTNPHADFDEFEWGCCALCNYLSLSFSTTYKLKPPHCWQFLEHNHQRQIAKQESWTNIVKKDNMN